MSARERPAVPGQEACVCTCGERTFDPLCKRHTIGVTVRPPTERDRAAEARTLIRTSAPGRDDYAHASLGDLFALSADVFADERDSMAERVLSSLIDELRVLSFAVACDDEGAIDSRLVERVLHRAVVRAEIATQLDRRIAQGGER